MGDKEARRRIREARETAARALDLSELDLEELPAEIGSLDTLASLDAHNNRLGELPPEIGSLTSLEALNLDGNKLTTLPAEIGELSRLTILDIGGNILGDLPPEVARLTSLTEVFLTVNQLTEVPESVLGIGALQSLHLTRNRLTSLPAQIGSLTNLSRLDADGNYITALPDEIGQLTKLLRLDLEGNQLDQLPGTLGELPLLTTLYLARNRFTEVPGVVLTLANLRELTLSGNSISSLPNDIGSLPTLERLDLTDNQLRRLPARLADLTALASVSARPSSPRTSSLLLQGNPLPESLLQAADEGIEQLWDHLRSEPPDDLPGEGAGLAPESEASVASPSSGRGWRQLSGLVNSLQFRDVIDGAEAQDLREQVESLIGWASKLVDSGALEDDPLVESQVTDDRNLLQRELIRSPSIDATVVVPHIQRLIRVLIRTIDETEPGEHTARLLVGKQGPDSRSTQDAVEMSETLSNALEDAHPQPPAGYSTWQRWLAERLGWLKGLDRTDIGLGGGALVTGSELASLLGASGPAGIVIGVVTATLAVVFRPRDED